MLYAQQSTTHYQDIYDWTSDGTLPQGVRVGGTVTLSDIQRALEDPETGLPTMGIQTEFVKDQIQFGKLFNKQIEDCLVLKNAQHPRDYFHFVFTTRTTGNMTVISFYRSGSSPLSGQKNKQEERKNSGTLFGSIAGALTKTDDRALNAEYDYYAMVADIIKRTFGI